MFLLSDPNRVNIFLNLLTLIFGAGGLGMILKYRLGTRRLSLDSEEAIRDHYAQEVAAMRAERRSDHEQFLSVERHLRSMLAESDRMHEECQRDRDTMRRTIDELTAKVKGLEAQLRQYSTDQLMLLEERGKPSESAPHSLGAAKRLKEKDRRDH